jgi:arabinan endo-1,5-alpha-L-arabinosidase
VLSTNGRPGNLIPIHCSPDLHQWTLCGPVFDKLPDWAVREIPRARERWALELSFYAGRYHLYYAVSTFGSNERVIGLATNMTLDSPESGLQMGRRRDGGAVGQGRNMERHRFQFRDGEKRARVARLGSFWAGIKMRRIDPVTGKFSAEDSTLYSLAERPRPEGNAAIEAPFLIRHGRYWYLFVSFDQCCRGANSTYRVMVGGRARSRGRTWIATAIRCCRGAAAGDLIERGRVAPSGARSRAARRRAR